MLNTKHPIKFRLVTSILKLILIEEDNKLNEFVEEKCLVKMMRTFK